MAEPETDQENDELSLETVKAPEGFEAFLLKLKAFPVKDAARSRAGAFVRRLSSQLLSGNLNHLEVFFQFNQLQVDGASDLVVQHGRDWIPKLSLGVYPDREPPRLWTPDDFMNASPSAPPPTLIHQLLRVTTNDEARHRARDILFGRGIILQYHLAGEPEEFLRLARERITPTIKDVGFRGFDWYAPLLSVNSLTEISAAALREWLCGARVMIRESAEDKGVLIVSAEPLGSLLRGIPL